MVYEKKLASLLSLALVVIALISIPVEAAAQPYAWPGRPGGNGDGSEEWLQGEYGQANGPYLKIYESQGALSNYGFSSGTETIASAIITAGVAKVHPLFGTVVTAAGIGNALNSMRYEGAYYRMVSKVSGRRMKIEINTYRDPNYQNFVKFIVHDIVW